MNHHVDQAFQERLPFYVANVFIPWDQNSNDSRISKEWAVVYVPYEDGFLMHDPNVSEDTKITKENMGNYITKLYVSEMNKYASQTGELYDGYRFLKAQYEARKDIMDNVAEEIARLNNMEWKRES